VVSGDLQNPCPPYGFGHVLLFGAIHLSSGTVGIAHGLSNSQLRINDSGVNPNFVLDFSLSDGVGIVL